MKRSVLGWGEGEGLRVLIPNMDYDNDDDPEQLGKSKLLHSIERRRGVRASV